MSEYIFNNSGIIIGKKKTGNQLKQVGSILISGNKILLYFLKFLGVLPFSTDKEDNLTFSWTSLTTLYTLFIAVLSIIAAVLNGLRGYEVTNAMGPSSKWLMIPSLIYPVMTVLSHLFLIDSKNIIIYDKEWRNFQRHYEAVTGRNLQGDYKVRQIICICTLIFISTSIALYVAFMSEFMARQVAHSNYGLNELLPLCFSIWLTNNVSIALIGFWYFALQTLEDTSQQLLTAFKKSHEAANLTPIFRQLWRELRELACGLTETFPLSLSFYILSSSISSMICWYIALTKPVGNRFLNILLAAVVTTIATIFPEKCHKTIEKMGTAFHKEILAQTRISKTKRHELELESFERTIMAFPTNFKVAGFISLNRHFNISIFSAYIQTLIVLYQLGSTGNVGN